MGCIVVVFECDEWCCCNIGFNVVVFGVSVDVCGDVFDVFDDVVWLLVIFFGGGVI